MEKSIQKVEKFSQSATWKAVVIGILTILLLIPGAMIESLIFERQQRSIATVAKINDKWSNAQTVNGPFLVIPYQIKSVDKDKNLIIEKHQLFLASEQLKINTKLTPEERHYGIYKSILYKSDIEMNGNFKNPQAFLPANAEAMWNEAHVRIGISDLRGISNDLKFKMNNTAFVAEAGGVDDAIGQGLIILLKNTATLWSDKGVAFSCSLKLNGSGDINFVPSGKTTQVQVHGSWKSPGFIGSFSPEYTLKDSGFNAKWNVLHFNRNIPECWSDNEAKSFADTSFGVNLVDPVDHYQQNMRSAKYSIMFIALTFVVFFFVEVITRKKIHPVQYLLVGLALVLFYSLLLSISEQLNFALAYLIASFATITLIAVYANSIFKNKTQTAILATILAALYVFLYVVLQLEDIALLAGSIGLFVILGIIMFVSRKISWYKPIEAEDTESDEAK